MPRKRRRGGLIDRARVWARRRRPAGPVGSSPRSDEVEDRLELARRRLKEAVPPRDAEG